MAETTFAKRFMAPQDEDETKPWRDGFGGDNAGGANPFCLSLRKKDSRESEGPSMSLFVWHYWLDDGGPVERLVLIFSVGAIYVEGLHMKSKVRALLEEGKLKYIQEHNSIEAEAIRVHNLDTGKPEEKEPTVLRLLIAPDLETRLRSDENLTVIAEAMKGEDRETGNTGHPAR